MNQRRIAFVAAHPAHLLSVLGTVLESRADVLMLTQTGTGPGSGQTDLIREALAMAGLQSRVDSLGIDERASYREALRDNFQFHTAAVPAIVAWLKRVRPTAVFGDAFELSNYQHDVGRLLLDAALEQYRCGGRSVRNFEFPLCCLPDRAGASLQYGRFLSGDFHTVVVDGPWEATKRRIVEWALARDPFLADVAPHFPGVQFEIFRPVSAARDYTQPPVGVARYYDLLGRQEVAAGRYTQAVLFDRHFVPLVHALRLTGSVRRSAA